MSIISLPVKTRGKPLLLGIINSDVVIAAAKGVVMYTAKSRSLVKEFGGHISLDTGINICAQLNSSQSKKGVC